jgi:tetratricopeptide (TPR) repeat protein
MSMRVFLILGAALCAASPDSVPAAEAKSGADAKDACRLGKSQYASGDVLKAIKSLSGCVERNPRNRDAWAVLAEANLEAGRFGPSVEAFAKAEALKSGDEAFLASYLSALEGAGKGEERIPVLRTLASKKPGERKASEALLAAVESAGPDRYPEDYLFALQTLADGPDAERSVQEKLAAAYLKTGKPEKAEAEYRGLLVRFPEAAEAWAGLGAAQSVTDPAAAAECYGKAAFYSDNAAQRQEYHKERERLAATASAPRNPSKVTPEEGAKEKDILAIAAMPSPTKEAPKPASPSQAADPKPSAGPTAQPAAAAKPKPFDVKAFQDSVYKAELEKRLAALRSEKGITGPVPASVTPTVPSPAAPIAAVPAAAASSPSAPAPSASASPSAANKEDEREKERQAKEEKAKRERLAKEAEKKAEEERERLAKAERARQDSIAVENGKRVKAEKERLESIAKAEKAEQDSIGREKEKQAKADKARRDSLDRVAALKAEEMERKAKEERERLAQEEKRKRAEEEKARKLKAEREQQERIARERRERFDKAMAHYRAGRMDSAALVFKTVLADTEDAEAYYYMGHAQLARREFGKALDALAKAPKDKSDLEGLKGRALMGLGRDKEALAALEAQYGKSRDDSLLSDLVSLKRRMGDAAGAAAYLERLAEKKPGEIRYQEELAAYYRSTGDRAKASVRYSKVFLLNTSHAEANYWLGMEAETRGDHEEAVTMLERAVASIPSRADAWKALAKGYTALGRKDQAWTAYAKALSLAPGDLETARALVALARESHPADLDHAYGNVLKIAPQDADAALGLAVLRYRSGDFAAAERNYRIAAKDSKDPHTWAGFGRSLLETKKTDEAAAALQKAVDLGEKDPALKSDLARIRMEKGDLDWAEALFKELAKKSPSDPEPLYWQGRIALKRQQTAVAEEFFRKSQQLKPEEGRYAEALARLLRDKDDWKSAASILKRAEAGLTASGRLLYGECLAHGGEMGRALEVYAELYKREPSAALLARRMDLLIRMGEADDAAALPEGGPFKDAVEVRYAAARAQLSLAEAHILKGDVELAVDLMKKVLKTDGHKPEYHYYLGLGYFGQNKWKKARGEFEDALSYRVEYPEALYRKGLCQIRLEDAKDAENSFGELSQHAEPVWKARGLYGLALSFEAQGKAEAVRHHLERSVEASPLPEAMAYLSRVSLGENKVSEAQDWARKALAADPSSEAATVALAEALAAGKNREEAMKLARQGLQAKPMSCGLLIQTAKLDFEAGRIDSSLARSTHAIQICPEEKMAYYYAGFAAKGTNPKESKRYFKSFRKLGGDKKLVPED